MKPSSSKQREIWLQGGAPSRKKAKTEKQDCSERVRMLDDPHQADADLDDDEEIATADEYKEAMAWMKLGKAKSRVNAARSQTLRRNGQETSGCIRGLKLPSC